MREWIVATGILDRNDIPMSELHNYDHFVKVRETNNDYDSCVAALVSALENVKDNYDCDVSAHKWNTTCRKCDAALAIDAYRKLVGGK